MNIIFNQTTTHIHSNSTVIIPSVTFDAVHRDSGGMVNILGGHNIGHCKKRSSYEHVCNSEWFTGRELFESTNTEHCEW